MNECNATLLQKSNIKFGKKMKATRYHSARTRNKLVDQLTITQIL